MTRFSITSSGDVLAWTTGLFWASCLLQQTWAKYVPYMPQSFFFDWTPPDQSPPVPTTAQCDTIHITWNRGNAVGPNPTAPYFLQIYTSTFIVPLIVPAGDSNSDLSFDFPVPWVPGTQYEICMFDINGNTGGCQGIYTVYPQPNLTTTPVCRNLSYPLQDAVLGVDAQVSNGPMSQFGWVDQCTDIQLTPKNGTPPYTMTIAPALHPPFNITSKTNDPINWTVSLSYGSPFFVSLADSSGLTWQNGPLHSGGGGSPSCLSQTDALPPSSPTEVHPWVAAISGIAGLIVGLLGGLLGAYFLSRWQRRNNRHDRPTTYHRKSSSISITTPVLTHAQDRYTDSVPEHIHTHRLRDAPYQIEPFVMPEQELGGRHGNDPSTRSGTVYDTSSHSPSASLSQDSRPSGPSSSLTPTSPGHPPPTSNSSVPLRAPLALSAENRQPSQVYVLHHDGGRAPVTVYTSGDAEIVELPPQYDSSTASSGATAGVPSTPGSTPHPLQERRQPGATPLKPNRRVANQG